MRAILCTSLGSPDQLTVADVADRPPNEGEVRVAVAAAGVNFADTLMVAGQYQVKPPLPFVPGAEFAGTVVDSGTEAFRAGDRVFGMVPFGAFAERVVAPAAMVRRIPAEMPFDIAGGFAIAYGTAHLALWHRAQLQPGETVLVTGASGGVGLAAVDVARALGSTVVAVVSNAEKGAVAAAHGAHEVIDLSKTELRAGIQAVTGGKGVDVVFETVGGDLFEPCLRSLRWNGRLLVIGFAGGRIPQVPANLALVKNVSVVGVYWGAYFEREPRTIQRSFELLFELWSAGRLHPLVSATLPLEDAPRALRLLRDRQATGKIVLVP
jgi:NADPH2:quinone reductase